MSKLNIVKKCNPEWRTLYEGGEGKDTDEVFIHSYIDLWLGVGHYAEYNDEILIDSIFQDDECELIVKMIKEYFNRDNYYV